MLIRDLILGGGTADGTLGHADARLASDVLTATDMPGHRGEKALKPAGSLKLRADAKLAAPLSARYPAGLRGIPHPASGGHAADRRPSGS
jgi:hypothetical protein